MIRLLAWDAPNMDMVLANLLNGKPTPAQRPDLGDLQQWFRHRCQPDEECEAAVFVNVPEHLADRLTTWALWLTQTGYRVFASRRSVAATLMTTSWRTSPAARRTRSPRSS